MLEALNTSSTSQVVGNPLNPSEIGFGPTKLRTETLGASQPPPGDAPDQTACPMGKIAAIDGGMELLASALQKRPSKIFIPGEKPAVSGEGKAVDVFTNGMVRLAVEGLPKAGGILDIPALERKPILGYSLDNEEALGYFLGDLDDHPLTPPYMP